MASYFTGIMRTTRLLTVFMVVALIMFASCSKNKNSEVSPTVPLVIFDTDIASSADDLFALAMLYRYEEQGRCRLLGVVVDREGEQNARFADVMATYYGRGDVPLALVRHGIDSPKVWIDYAHVAATTDENGQPLFGHTIGDYTQLPDGWQLYRRLLVSQPDHSVSIVSVGFVTCLAQLLESEGDEYSPLTGIELVRRKVKCLYLQGGVFGDAEEGDFNFSQGMAFAETFFRLWPQEVDMVFSPMEVGQGVEYRPEQVVADIAWTDVHPIKQVYLQCNCNTGQKMWDPMVVIQAVEGDTAFSLSERGTVQFTDAALTLFTPAPDGLPEQQRTAYDHSGANCRYQLPGDAAWNTRILESIRSATMHH